MDIVIPVAIPLSSGAEYDQLSTFLSLSSDRFAVYTVVFVNLAQQPVQPEDPVEIALDIPADYDMSRVAVSEISVEGETTGQGQNLILRLSAEKPSSPQTIWGSTS